MTTTVVVSVPYVQNERQVEIELIDVKKDPQPSILVEKEIVIGPFAKVYTIWDTRQLVILEVPRVG